MVTSGKGHASTRTTGISHDGCCCCLFVDEPRRASLVDDDATADVADDVLVVARGRDGCSVEGRDSDEEEAAVVFENDVTTETAVGVVVVSVAVVVLRRVAVLLSVVAAVLDYVLIALQGHGQIILGDAPMQDCDFNRLMHESGYLDMVHYYQCM